MYVLRHYPQISESYIKTELEAVRDRYDIAIISRKGIDIPYEGHLPYQLLSDYGTIREAVEEFQPDLLHSHWLPEAETLGRLAQDLSIPFTVRSHSFDILTGQKRLRLMRPSRRIGRKFAPPNYRTAIDMVRDDHCLGVLGFPFARPKLEVAGVPSEKIHDCFPVVDYAKFHDRSRNGDAIMNAGACLPKKQMEDFIDLAGLAPELDFNLYALGFYVAGIRERNEAAGNPVTVVPPVQPDDMPAEYKRHRWLVYTASRRINTVGWPLSVAEAQASGVGVCMANLRPDMKQYVGDAGHLFDSVAEVVDIIKGPVPEELRERGFEQARKSDIKEHLPILTDLWDSVAPKLATAV